MTSTILGGLLTLVGTPPNIVLVNTLKEQGLAPFSFFEFALLGAPLLFAYLVYVLLTHRKSERTPARHGDDPGDAIVDVAESPRVSKVDERILRLRVRAGSPLIGRILGEVDLSRRFGVQILHVLTAEELSRLSAEDHRGLDAFLRQEPPALEPVSPETRFEADCMIVVTGNERDIHRMVLDCHLGLSSGPVREELRERLLQEYGVAEIVLTPRSGLAGKTLAGEKFSSKHGVRVLGIMRNGKSLPVPFIWKPLAFGDALMVYGKWSDIQWLRKDTRNFIVVGKPAALTARPVLTPRSGLAVLALAGMVGLMLSGVVSLPAAAMSAALFMVLTGCLNAEEAYASINWQSIVLIAAMLPLSTALQNTGGARFLADAIVGLLGGGHALFLLAGIYLMTMAFSQVISNTAATILLAPIAMQSSSLLGISTYPVFIMVAAGASSAFLTPIASPVNTLVLGPGGYRFSDFAKAGIAPVLLVLILALIITPLIWPV